ncbi:hypothetical protein DFJ73DRAFT_139806 [Zopfochytrium polystomum]|nr:hypothetical protein DFJ73DRAFT_139806 [Zopfochytrium polystomum]
MSHFAVELSLRLLSLPVAIILDVARLADVGSLLRLSRSCRFLRSLILESQSLWVNRLADIARAANLPLTPNRTFGLRGLRNLVLHVDPPLQTRSSPERPIGDEGRQAFEIQESTPLRRIPLGDPASPPRQQSAVNRRVVGITMLYSLTRGVGVRLLCPCILKDRAGILMGGNMHLPPMSDEWNWLDIHSGERIWLPTTSTLSSKPSDRITSIPGTDFLVRYFFDRESYRVSLDMLIWDSAAADFVPVVPCPLAREPALQALLAMHHALRFCTSAAPDGSAWLWFSVTDWESDESVHVVAFRLIPVLDRSGAASSHEIAFVRAIKITRYVEGGRWGRSTFGAGVFSVEMLFGDEQKSVRVVRATDGAVILERCGAIDLAVFETTAYTCIDETRTEANFEVLDLVAACCSVRKEGQGDTASRLRLSTNHVLKMSLYPFRKFLTSTLHGCRMSLFQGSPWRMQVLDMRTKRCQIFSAEMPPDLGRLAVVVLFEELRGEGAATLTAEYHQTSFEM